MKSVGGRFSTKGVENSFRTTTVSDSVATTDVKSGVPMKLVSCGGAEMIRADGSVRSSRSEKGLSYAERDVQGRLV